MSRRAAGVVRVEATAPDEVLAKLQELSPWERMQREAAQPAPHPRVVAVRDSASTEQEYAEWERFLRGVWQ